MKTIVVGFDEGKESRDALHFGDRLARLEGPELQVAAAGLFESRISTGSRGGDAPSALRRLFATVEDELGPRRFSPRVLEGLSVTRALIDHAEAEDVDLMVVGSTHRGRIGKVLPGSVGAQLLNRSPCPVATVPRGFSGFRERIRGRIGIALDGSQEAMLALEEAERLAELLEVDLRVITVIPAATPPAPPAATAEPPENARRRFIEGDPARALVECCRELDLLVLGSNGGGALRRTALGGVSAHVLANASCPVVVVPRGAQTPV
jgi:nucleotide-binding universal stress UspA family protein